MKKNGAGTREYRKARGVSRRAACLPIFALLFLSTAHAQLRANAPTVSELTEMSLEQLSQIPVTSVSKKPQRLADAAASVYVITNEDIRRSGAASLPEALRLAPNLQVSRINASEYAISARGFATTTSNKLLVLIDGRAAYTPLFSGVFWNAQEVNLQDVERIEVVSGPGSTTWGTNAVVGVINVITRPATETLGGYVRLTAGDDERWAAARYGTPLGPNSAIRIHARHIEGDETHRADGTRVPDAWKRTKFGFRADGTSGINEWTIQGDAYEGEYQQAAPGSRTASGRSLLVSWDRAYGDGSSLHLQAYYDHTKRDHPTTFSEELDIFDVEFRHSVRPLGNHVLTWGMGYRTADDTVTNGASPPARPHRSLASRRQRRATPRR